MNCTLTRATSAELNIYSVPDSIQATVPPDTFSENQSYATAPMAAVLPPYQPPSEEELHTSFEQAISKRTDALYRQSGRYSYRVLSAPAMHSVDRISHSIHAQTTSNVTATRKQRRLQLFPSSAWQRCVVVAALALIFMLIGFDLMGLLILHMH